MAKVRKLNKNAPGSKVALYARVSTEEQAGEDHYSIDAQLNEMQEFSESKGWEIVGRFMDEGISGTKRERPELNAMLDMARRRECDIIIVHELSRLSRSVYHTLDIFDFLGNHQIGFASVKEPDFDFTDPSKRFFLTIMAAINEYYVELLRQHTSKSKRERAKQGLYNASLMPYGYDLSGDPGKPGVVNPEEAKVIRLAFESYATGRYSDQDIADLLNNEGYRTRTDRRFPKDAIPQLLNNPYYIGIVTHRNNATGEEETFQGQHEALISLELWERTQEVRNKRRTASRSVQKNYRHYLLSQLAFCDVCGRTLRAQGATAGSYYREMSYERGYLDCPHQKTGVRSEILEKQIHALVEHIQLPQDWIEEVANLAGDDEQIIKLRKQRDRLEAERERIQRMRIEGEFEENMDFYHEEMARIRRESANLPNYDQIETLRITAETIGNLPNTWRKADAGDQRDLLRLLLREVKVDVINGRVTSISPLPVFIPIFRQIPILSELEFGEFIPLWPESETSRPISQESILKPGPISPIWPFADSNPLLPDTQARNTPGIAEALRQARSGTKRVQADIAQLTLPELPELPMDLRKWPEVSEQPISVASLPTRASLDVLVTQFALYTQGNHLAEDLAASLRPGGVWHFIELLPLDCRSHWLYRTLPGAWDIAKQTTWTLYTLYNRLQGLGLTARLKRHAFAQPVSPLAAREILSQRPGLLRSFSDHLIQTTIEQLPHAPLPSEFTIIEGWAQAPAG